MEDLRYINRQLRRNLDPKEPFSSQIIKPRTDDKKGVPEWATSDAEIRIVVLRVFPRWQTDPRHRLGAARWIRIAHLFWRVGLTRGQVVEEMQTAWPSITPKVVDHVTRNIRLAHDGKSSRARPYRQRGGYRPGSGRKSNAGQLKQILAAT